MGAEWDVVVTGLMWLMTSRTSVHKAWLEVWRASMRNRSAVARSAAGVSIMSTGSVQSFLGHERCGCANWSMVALIRRATARGSVSSSA
jgi:hypothetical protein